MRYSVLAPCTSMAHEFPSEEWIRAWQSMANDDEEYGRAAEGWGVDFNGDLLFHLRSDERLPEDRYYFAELVDGKVRNSRPVDDPEAIDYGFALRADYTDWVRLVDGEIEPVACIMTCIFDVDGDVRQMLEYSDAVTRLVEIAAAIDSTYRY